MQIFTNNSLEIANANDLTAIEYLLNAAYRGPESNKGWTTEAHLISGEIRTTPEQLLETFHLPDSVFLKYTDTQKNIVGCVNLQKHHNKVYLGMFAVNPNQQGVGIGKFILKAAEEWTAHMKLSMLYMTVITKRNELIDWYIRHGYKDTGLRKPFVEDNYSGKHLQQLEFMVLEKTV